MPDNRFREWIRTDLEKSGAALATYASTANQLEKRFGIRSMTLRELRELNAEIRASKERDNIYFVLVRNGERHDLHPNVRMMLREYIRYREETGVRPAAKPQAVNTRSVRTTDQSDRDYRLLTSRKAVINAMQELAGLTDEQIRDKYRFAPARSFVVRYGRHTLPSKAVVGVAFRYQHPAIGPLTPDDFSGGKTQAGRHLSRLGFDVDGVERRPDDWTRDEVEYIVSAYFGMLRAKAARSYSRKKHLDDAEAILGPRRSPGSIGRKLSNISAILEDLGLPVLEGFPALGNKQTLLTAVVTDWLAGNEEVLDDAPSAAPSVAPAELEELEVEPPAGSTLERVRRGRRGCKVDFAARDARNRALGRAGEKWALEVLRQELVAKGRADLAATTRWESDLVGDGLGYDIVTFDSDGSERYVEVKTTNQAVSAPFILTENELAASQELGGGYVLMRIFAFNTKPQFYRLNGDLSSACVLRPISFSVTPRAAGECAVAT